MHLRNIVAVVAISIAIVVPNATHAASAVSITRVTQVMGDTHVTFSNGITCTDNDGHPAVGPVTNFYSGWWAYWYTQGGIENDCN